MHRVWPALRVLILADPNYHGEPNQRKCLLFKANEIKVSKCEGNVVF